MTYVNNSITLLLFCLLIPPISAYCQLSVNPNQTALVLSSKLAGLGITISSPVLTCTGVANGTFISVSTPITIDSGILLTSGRSINTIGAESILANNSNGTPGDISLGPLAMATTYDACALEFDFIPNGDTVSFNYQFGSEEYINSTCGPYNDAFAFFISGPGITGTQNMALVPGTTIPITVNSVNSGVPGAGYSLANCTAMGAGSPFTAYYFNNAGGTLLTYRGFTVKMKAFHSVTPCSTYHLKMAICDAGNRFYDSGVFIEAGSLKTNSFSFDHSSAIGATINGIPNAIVKGCSPAIVKIKSARTAVTTQKVRFLFGGTSVHGTDFLAPDSALIAVGADSVMINISGIPTPLGGVKTLKVYLLSPFSCGIADSIDLNIMDTPSAYILTPDTTICNGGSFTVAVTGTSGLVYAWSPPDGLSNPSVSTPVMAPTVTTSYTMTATLPNSGCPPINRNITVTVIDAMVSLLTPDTILCNNGSVTLNVSGPSTVTYSWSPPDGLSNASIPNPVASPTVATTYTLTATAGGGLCTTVDTVRITVGLVDVGILTGDTTICKGASLAIAVDGDQRLIYNWAPATGIYNPNTREPVISPNITTTYTMTASFSGTPCYVTDEVTIFVKTIDMYNITPSQSIKYGKSIQLYVEGTEFYMWSPNDGSLDNNNINNPIATPQKPTVYTVYGMDKSGCRASASVKIDLFYDDVAIPDAFTPNGDGINDNFTIANMGYYKLVEMSVFNRWGNLVYHSAGGSNSGWDGTYNGTPQDLGSYSYLLIISAPDGGQKQFKGIVTLIR